MAKITCYDGVGCIGGNKILLEDDSSKLFLDFGLNFGRMGKFYEEYLKPKTSLGLYEPIQMGLLPPIRDLYRPDLICDLANPWNGIEAREIGKVDGVLVSHAHMDHIGAIPYIREDIPIFSSAMSLAIAKATQDTGTGSNTHYCYTSPFEVSDTGELKSAHHSKNPSKARPFKFVGESPSKALAEFWGMTPSSLTKSGRQHETVAIGESAVCGGMKVLRFPVDHSIYGASAWAVETASGWVVYAGDIRCHGRYGNLTWEFAEAVNKLKPRALIIEGTRIDNESTSTEDGVRDRALGEVKKAKGLVVADFGPRNVERLASFLDIAKQTERKLLLLPKDAYLLDAMRLAGNGDVPSLDDSSILIYNKYEAASSNWKKVIYEKYGGKLVQPSQLAANQDKAVCCFSFFDVNELAYIKPVAGSIWIYSSCEPFSEDMKMDMAKLNNWLNHCGIALLGVTEEGEEEKSPFHVSGHACRSDLLKVVDVINPQTVIPVHTEKPELYVEALRGKCEVLLPERGQPISL